MWNVEFELIDGKFQVKGFPDAVALVEILEGDSKRLAHLALHFQDLSLAKECLVLLAKLEENSDLRVVRESLWTTSLVNYYKCFQRNESRSSLDPALIYESGLPMEVFSFFKALRNKTVVHDENDWNQFAIGAVLDSPDADETVPAVLGMAMRAGAIDEANWQNMTLLVGQALMWVENEYDSENDRVRARLNSWSRQDLLNLKDLVMQTPSGESIRRKRTTPRR